MEDRVTRLEFTMAQTLLDFLEKCAGNTAIGGFTYVIPAAKPFQTRLLPVRVLWRLGGQSNRWRTIINGIYFTDGCVF